MLYSQNTLMFRENEVEWPDLQDIMKYDEYYNEQSVRLVTWAFRTKKRTRAFKLIKLADKLETAKRDNLYFLLIGRLFSDAKTVSVVDVPAPYDEQY